MQGLIKSLLIIWFKLILTEPLERNNVKSALSKKNHIFNGTLDDPTYLSNRKRLGKGKSVCA